MLSALTNLRLRAPPAVGITPLATSPSGFLTSASPSPSTYFKPTTRRTDFKLSMNTTVCIRYSPADIPGAKDLDTGLWRDPDLYIQKDK
ncbi:hypothetical protein B0H11DRAFT_226799 [Mycena galericulata]|nr:hypothetical protein B0H11DRAFT_226799 [Mycena galericulata]